MEDKVFKDTPIIPGVFRASDLPGVPSKIQQMRQMYEYGGVGNSLQAKNFYRQGKFMEDFEDNATVSVHFQHYFPTYHDMNVSQLRTFLRGVPTSAKMALLQTRSRMSTFIFTNFSTVSA